MEEKKQTGPVLEPLGSAQEVEQAIEAILFAAGHPMRYDKLAEVLSLTVKDVRAMVRSYDRRRRLMVEGFRSMGLDCFEPLGAFYVFPSIRRTGLSSEEFCTRLLSDKKVACVPGTAFGACGEGHIRCSYATSIENLTEALKRIRAFVREL